MKIHFSPGITRIVIDRHEWKHNMRYHIDDIDNGHYIYLRNREGLIVLTPNDVYGCPAITSTTIYLTINWPRAKWILQVNDL